jgi:hypothetical protein
LKTSSSSAFAYLRPSGDDPSGSLLVILNFGGKEKVTIDLTPDLVPLMHTSLADHLTGKPVSFEVTGTGVVGDKASIRMDGVSALVIGVGK